MPHKTPTLEERRALARRHVEAGRLIIIHQRQMVERHKAEGRDTKAAEELLAVLERTQKAFERDLADLEKRRLPRECSDASDFEDCHAALLATA